MSIQTRIGLVVCAVALALLLMLVVVDLRLVRHAAAEELTNLVVQENQREDWMSDCESTPSTWTGTPPERKSPPSSSREMANSKKQPSAGRPPPKPDHKPDRMPQANQAGSHRRMAYFYAYDELLNAFHPDAPLLDQTLQGKLNNYLAIPVSPLVIFSDEVEVLVKLPVSGVRCHYVLATGTLEPWMSNLLPGAPKWLLTLSVVIATLLLALRPLVRRIKRLTEMVTASQGSGFTSPVLLSGNDELAALAKAFNASSEEIHHQLSKTQHREQALRDYMSNTNHDLLIPLTVLQGHLHSIGVNDSNSNFVNAAKVEAHYIGMLVHNLSAAAKLDHGIDRIESVRVDLVELVQRVSLRHRTIAKSSGISLESAAPDSLDVLGDVTMLEQAVTNLVYNAIHYNENGNHVAIVLDGRDSQFTLTVVDDGPGVSIEELDLITSRGYRGSKWRGRKDREGSGLGLYIASSVIHLHGFQLTLDNMPQGGTSARITGDLLTPAENRS